MTPQKFCTHFTNMNESIRKSIVASQSFSLHFRDFFLYEKSDYKHLIITDKLTTHTDTVKNLVMSHDKVVPHVKMHGLIFP